jgi:predicted amidohydrolase
MTPEPPTQDQQEEIQQLLKTGTREDENTALVLSAIEQKKNRHPFLQLAQCEAKGELLYYRDKIYVPEYEDLRTKVIRQHYDNPSAGHPGRTKTFELVSRHYC